MSEKRRFRRTLDTLVRSARRTLSTTQGTAKRRRWSSLGRSLGTTARTRRPKERYPEQVWDRRALPNARPDHPERRGASRYVAGLPVTVRVGGRSWRGKIRNLSESGMLLGRIKLPADTVRMRMEFAVPAGIMPEGFDSSFNVTGRVLRREPADGSLGVRFDRSLADVLRSTAWRRLRLASWLVMAISLGALAWLKEESSFLAYFDPLLFAYGVAVIGYLLSRILFAAFYRPVARGDSDYMPTVSMIIPCYNEARSIERTVIQSLDQRYPADRYEVVVVNDGSTDRSHEVLDVLSRRFPQLKYVPLAQNVGKRRAMAAGFEHSVGEVVVFADSDSFVEPDGIEKLVVPLQDPKVGAVCGHCEVENKWTNIYTKMQAVRYFVAFRIMKAAESVFDSVTCLSGPLSAYRRSAIAPVVKAWTRQRFLGVEATFGDDRSLTNYILPKHKIVYQSTAVTSTLVPATFEQLFKQQLRWKRSWVRESIRAGRFMWRKQPFMAVSFYLGFLLPMISPLVAFRALLLLPVQFGSTPDGYLFGVLFMSSIFSASYILGRRSRLWPYGIAFSYFYLFVLLWQLPFATATYWARRWGTR